jgi:hypothetical protein
MQWKLTFASTHLESICKSKVIYNLLLVDVAIVLKIIEEMKGEIFHAG